MYRRLHVATAGDDPGAVKTRTSTVVVIAVLLTLVIGILLESKTRGGHDSEESSRSRVVNRVVKLGKDLRN